MKPISVIYYFMATQKTILIVEDEAALGGALDVFLRKENFLCLRAANGEEALNLAFSKHPDLILLDLVLPGMNGLDILQKIRENKWGSQVDVIILTNLDETNAMVARRILMLGPISYLIKSDCKLCTIVKKIKEVFAK